MRRMQQGLLWLSILMVAAESLSPALLGQAASEVKADAGLPTDWSHHHVIFSRPATAEQTARVQRDPRYWQQIARQSPARLTEARRSDALASELQVDANAKLPVKNHKLQRDWAEDLGSSATVGAGNYPAKYSLRITTANCAGAAQPDFVVYSTGLTGSSSQASMVAFDNLYSGCSGTVPGVYWAYNTGGGTIGTSPVFSLDGTQVAFTQADALGNGSLVLLKWAASTTETIISPLSLTAVSAASYATCATPPCMTTLALTDSALPASDTSSSVFYDYSSDTAYVGDDSGFLHKFNPVFNGVPKEVTSLVWPVPVNILTPMPLTDPVYDTVTGNVFVEDEGGYLYAVNSTTGAVTQSGLLDYSTANDDGPGFVQGPVVDSSAALVYVFAPSDGSGLCTGGADCAVVYELTTTFLANATGTKATVGNSTTSGSTPNPLYIGGFDSVYQNSTDPPTGHIYVCGNTGATPTLYQVPITAGAFGAAIAGPALAETTVPCSPVTDVLNPNASAGPTEWIFASESIEGVGISGCSGGCIYNFNDTPWQPSTLYSVGQEVLVTAGGGLQIEVVSVAGTSGATQPGWHAAAFGASTSDNGVTWLNQGVLRAPVLSGWTPLHRYSAGTEIVDTNGNIELVTITTGNGNSGSSRPAFSLTAGGTVTAGMLPNTVTWENLGAIASADLAAAGGTSGVIIDNTVVSGTLAGTSQVYFSTLSDQTCATSGGSGGCAVQASQPALH